MLAASAGILAAGIHALIDWLNRKSMPPQVPAAAPKPAANPQGSAPAPPAPLPTMLILRGIKGHFPNPAFDGQLAEWPRGALDEPPALEYARRRGYCGQVLDIDGHTGPESIQVKMCLTAFRADKSVEALYGFSGGGFNVRHVLTHLLPSERDRLKLVVVLGAPEDPPYLFRGPWELIYRTNPPQGHMYGPRALLAQYEAQQHGAA